MTRVIPSSTASSAPSTSILMRSTRSLRTHQFVKWRYTYLDFIPARCKFSLSERTMTQNISYKKFATGVMSPYSLTFTFHPSSQAVYGQRSL